MPFCADGVDLVDKNNGWSMLLGKAEQLADKLGAVTRVLLNELGAHNAEKGGGGLVGHGLGKKRFAYQG